MKIYIIACVFILSLFCVIRVKSQTPGKVVVPADSILKNTNSLLNYYSDHLRLSGDFLAYDAEGKPITRERLLKQTITGNYLPLQIYSKQNTLAYRLYKLSANTNDDVRQTLKQIGNTDYSLFESIGNPLPKFHFVDLNGNTYTSANTKGKILVLKAWMISCIPCVNEMPELNKLVDKYKNRKDIIFVSIAYDSREKLRAFMKHRTFKYAVVSMPISYIQDTLHVTGYPAHWVINKQGIVVSKSYDKSDMITALDKEAQKQ
jgi:peroxiredoxin